MIGGLEGKEYIPKIGEELGETDGGKFDEKRSLLR